VPKGLRTLEFSFADTDLTHFGGLVLLQRFCQRLGLRRRLQREVSVAQRQGHYNPADLVLALIFVMVAGLRRVSKTQILQYNGAFLSLLGLEHFPDPSSLRRFLNRLSPQTIRQLVRLHDRLRASLTRAARASSSLVLDLDSVVITLYGHQQGARLGYNPKKRGRRSYHPLLCFEAQGGQFWHGSLRPGNTTANTAVLAFLERCRAKIPAGMHRARVRLRADAGFFSGRMFHWLEQQGWSYVVVARQHPGIRRAALGAKFITLGGGWQVGEFLLRAGRWPQPRRFVVVRRPVPEDPAEAAQLQLFRHQQYAYSILTTNLALSAWRVWRFYVQRGTIEKTIRELIYDLPLSQIPSTHWLANVAYFHILMLAYNLVHWFKHQCLPSKYARATVETIRREFLAIPGRLTHPGGQHVLQLPRDYPLKKEFLSAAQKIQRVGPSRA